MSELSMGASMEVLAFLKEEPRHTPESSHKAFQEREIKYSKSSIKQALHGLLDTGLVEQESHGLYLITPLGLKALQLKYNQVSEEAS